MTWNDISIQQFKELHKTFENKSENPVDKLNNKVLQVAIVTGKDLEEVEEMTLGDIEKINKFLNSDLPTKIRKRFKLNGVRYEFELDATKLDAVDYMYIMQMVEKDPYENLHSIMYSISKPIKFTALGWKRYSFEPSEVHKRIEDFKQMPVSVAHPIAVFFCNLSQGLMNVLADYSEENLIQMTKKMDKLAEDLKDGDGL